MRRSIAAPGTLMTAVRSNGKMRSLHRTGVSRLPQGAAALTASAGPPALCYLPTPERNWVCLGLVRDAQSREGTCNRFAT